jgi:hypothetical protein
MDYRIISADAIHGQIHVTYSEKGVDIATYVIDVPIEDGKFITGDKLDTEIRSREPIWLLQRKAVVAAAEDFHLISSLVQAPAVTKPESPKFFILNEIAV